MRILLTNNSLAAAGGTELYVRDVAVELMRRGHHPVVYSTSLGAVAEELRAATVPVVDRLDSVGELPDIIHGQHHYETITALLRFPNTPAVYYCHGWAPWEEAPFRHPNILGYVAVDQLCRERLIAEGGIHPDHIDLVFNFFDERLFPPRPPLPKAPKRALAFSNQFSETSGLPILFEACARCGVELHARGLDNGNPTAQPGRMLAGYDVVFAKARCAIEAMAVGAAVVLCTPSKAGPMVTAENFSLLRQWNFGARTLTRPLDVDVLTAELRKYDSEDAARVSRLARGACEMQPAVDRILDIYRRVLASAAGHQHANSSEASAAAARYLEQWSAKYKAHFTVTADRDQWIKRCTAAEQALAQRSGQTHEMDPVAEYNQGWIDRCLAGERAPTELDEGLSGRSEAADECPKRLDEIRRQRQYWAGRSAATELALAQQKRLSLDAEQRALQTQALLSQRDADRARLAQELEAVRSSATWRWTQGILQSSLVQRLFGGLIHSVAVSRKP